MATEQRKWLRHVETFKANANGLVNASRFRAKATSSATRSMFHKTRAIAENSPVLARIRTILSRKASFAKTKARFVSHKAAPILRKTKRRLGRLRARVARSSVTSKILKASFWISLAVVIGALGSSVVTFLLMNGLLVQWGIYPTSTAVIGVLSVNALFVVAIASIIGYQIVKLLRARQKQMAGAGLHFKIAGIFSLVALFPAILLAVFATVSVNRTFDQFFSTHVQSIVSNSVDVANSYLQEHGQVIRSDMLGIASELEANAALFRDDREAFRRLFLALITLRAIPSGHIIDAKGKILLAAVENDPRYKSPSPEYFTLAENGVVPLAWDLTNGVSGLKKLNGFDNAYLQAVRPVNADALRLLQRTGYNIERFRLLKESRSIYEAQFAIMYLLLALILLASAIWSGLVFANRLVTPIRKLIGAAQEVSQGNLNVQLDRAPANDDIGRLHKTFKQMTVDLKTQRDDIMSANAELEERRRFIEAVLSGVTAGVIGLDTLGRVTLVNRSACELLAFSEATLIGKRLVDLVPEFSDLLEKSRRQGRKPTQSQVTLVRETGERNFAVQITREQENHVDYGVVVTFDDVTELTVAQRTSAWADVARRIAHEIKNPLTPIQLSAERIRRKYGASITTDREVFDRCTDTIIRHVGDIGRMVDEFSSFARMPQPTFELQNINEIVREAVILFQMSRPDIEFIIDVPTAPVEALCDRRLLTQAVTNLVKNATEGVDAFYQTHSNNDPDNDNGGKNGNGSQKGKVTARLSVWQQRFTIDVLDNGCGLPKENRHRLVEPYVTTRQKGTGLGLAIVQRITEQHGGILELADSPASEGYQHGAWIKMSFPLAVSMMETPAEKEDLRVNGSHQDRPAQHGKEGVSYGV